MKDDKILVVASMFGPSPHVDTNVVKPYQGKVKK